MKRYLLKLSGEALIGKYNYGIDPDVVNPPAVECSIYRSSFNTKHS